MGMAWGLAGVLCFLSIVGFPFVVASFRIAGFSFFPFGRAIEDRREASSWGSTPFALACNIAWVLLFGCRLALGRLSSALLCAVTVIGIPFPWQHLKLPGSRSCRSTRKSSRDISPGVNPEGSPFPVRMGSGLPRPPSFPGLLPMHGDHPFAGREPGKELIEETV